MSTRVLTLRELNRATLDRQMLLEPFERLSRGDRDALSEEGERLVRFLAEPQGAKTFDVSFA